MKNIRSSESALRGAARSKSAVRFSVCFASGVRILPTACACLIAAGTAVASDITDPAVTLQRSTAPSPWKAQLELGDSVQDRSFEEMHYSPLLGLDNKKSGMGIWCGDLDVTQNTPPLGGVAGWSRAPIDARNFWNIVAEWMASPLGKSNSIVGMNVTLMDNFGNNVAYVNCGVARKEFPRPVFSFNTQTPWGSVSKVIAAVAVLNLIEKRPDLSLDDDFRKFLPVRWRNSVHWRFRAPENPVTLRMLLSHRGGFRRNPCAGEGLPQVLSSGHVFPCSESESFHPPAVGTERAYSNVGIELFNLLLPYMEHPIHFPSWEWSFHLGTLAYDRYVVDRSQREYLKYVKNMAAAVNVQVDCRMGEVAASHLNHTHWFVSPSSQGTLPNVNIDVPSERAIGKCAQGGIIMSPADMGRFMHAVTNTNSIISMASRNLMRSSWKDSLGWWRVSYDGRALYEHNGGLGQTAAVVITEPSGYTALANVNTASSLNPWSSFQDMLRYALSASVSEYRKTWLAASATFWPHSQFSQSFNVTYGPAGQVRDEVFVSYTIHHEDVRNVSVSLESPDGQVFLVKSFGDGASANGSYSVTERKIDISGLHGVVRGQWKVRFSSQAGTGNVLYARLRFQSR